MSNDKGGVEDYDNKLVQSKKFFKIITALNFRFKENCPNLFFMFKDSKKGRDQESGQGSKEGIPIDEFSKIEQGFNEGKGEESISDSQSLNDYHYFRSEEYFPDSYFNNFGIQNIEHKQSEHMHYYKIPYSEILEKNTMNFQVGFHQIVKFLS